MKKEQQAMAIDNGWRKNKMSKEWGDPLVAEYLYVRSSKTKR